LIQIQAEKQVRQKYGSIRHYDNMMMKNYANHSFSNRTSTRCHMPD